MNTPPTPPKRGLRDGLDDLIKTALNPLGCNDGYGSTTTARRINRREPPIPDLKRLVNELWRQIAVNWVEDGCQSRGSFNWRWELRTTGGEKNRKSEVGLQRKIARLIDEAGRAGHWSSETPTASGLSKSDSGNPGGLDLARKYGDECVDLIELKVVSEKGSSYTPIAAAFQIVEYGLMLTLARLVNDKVPIIVDDDVVWKSLKLRARLLVFAPHEFYSPYLGLRLFEEELDAAVGNFGDAHGLPMSFAFRSFDRDSLQESELIERLGEKGKIPWK